MIKYFAVSFMPQVGVVRVRLSNVDHKCSQKDNVCKVFNQVLTPVNPVIMSESIS